jgi:predicted protein tyrosine phosphatase
MIFAAILMTDLLHPLGAQRRPWHHKQRAFRTRFSSAFFVCGKARTRSPAVAGLAARLAGISADFAGLSADADANADANADERLLSEHIDWVAVIFVMERRQKKRLSQLFSDRIGARRGICPNIPDGLRYMEDALVAPLHPAMEQALRR